MLCCTLIGPSYAQMSLSHPINRAVYQRNSSGNATIPIAGQHIGSIPSRYGIEYSIDRISPVNGSYQYNAVYWTSVGNQNPAYGLYNTTVNLPTGWYAITVRAYDNLTDQDISSATTKFGVGDVYVIAGQSNAQGASTTLPSETEYDAVSRSIASRACEMDYPPYPTLGVLYNNAIVGPSGNNQWCWGNVGRRLIDNGGAPVAFFNAAQGGSTIENWSSSAANQATSNFYIGGQWCGTGHIGQPYKSFRDCLNFYGSTFGIKAVLWHQGESDNETYGSSLNKTSQTDYTSRLEAVVNASRNDFNAGLNWLVSDVSFNGNSSPTTRADVTNAQAAVRSAKSLTNGADTDMYGTAYRNTTDLVHFDNLRSNGIIALGYSWYQKLTANSGAAITANTPPTLSVAASGSQFIISASGNYDDYYWVDGSSYGPHLNNYYTTGSSITVSKGGTYLCYGRKGNTYTPSQWFNTGCSTCRRRNGDWDESEVGVSLSISPNPVQRDAVITFSLPTTNQVRLELISQSGQILSSVASGQHAKGTYTYPVSAERLIPSVYYYRLTVGDLAITKKMLKAD